MPIPLAFRQAQPKLMTIFVALEAAAKGEIDLNAPIKVSGHAAAAPPVKLGLKKGESIRLGDAIHAALIVSSNDAARMIAEAVAGSEQAFAQRMTAAACRIGMYSNTFRNASGLPDAGHISTAADIGRLIWWLDQQHGEYLRPLFREPLTWRGATKGPRKRYGSKRHGRPVRQDRLYQRSRVRGGNVGRNFKRNPRVRDDGEFGTWAPGKIAETLG